MTARGRLSASPSPNQSDFRRDDLGMVGAGPPAGAPQLWIQQVHDDVASGVSGEVDDAWSIGRGSWRAPCERSDNGLVDRFVERGDVVGIGPFADGGNTASVRSRSAAEAFVAEDLIVEGLVASFTVQPWPDRMLS